jgi:hypothetical protein
VDPNIPHRGAATRSTAAELWGALAPDKRAEIRPGDIRGFQTLEWWPAVRETWYEASGALGKLLRPAGETAWLRTYFDAGVHQICAPPAKSVARASWDAYIWLCHLAALRDLIVLPLAERWFDGVSVLGCDTRCRPARTGDTDEVWSGQASSTCLAALGPLDTYWDVLDQLAERLKPPPTAEELRAAAEERRHQETLAAQIRIAEALNTLAKTPEPAPPTPAAPPAGKANGEKSKARKKQETVTVDPAWLIDELKELNPKRKPPQKQLELNHDLSDKHALSKLAMQLKTESPPGGPNKQSWEKLLTGQPVRSDVAKQHLTRFFDEHLHRLKNGIQYLKT